MTDILKMISSLFLYSNITDYMFSLGLELSGRSGRLSCASPQRFVYYFIRIVWFSIKYDSNGVVIMFIQIVNWCRLKQGREGELSFSVITSVWIFVDMNYMTKKMYCRSRTTRSMWIVTENNNFLHNNAVAVITVNGVFMIYIYIVFLFLSPQWIFARKYRSSAPMS